MIIGKGMMAKRFACYEDNKEVIIFASGVSNSKEDSEAEFRRERDLLFQTCCQYPDTLLVYFSTYSVHEQTTIKTPYVRHKLLMEQFISEHFSNYYLFRVSQIIGAAKNSTLINFLIAKILSSTPFELWSNTQRNVIALDDVYQIIHHIIEQKLLKNQVINIIHPKSLYVHDLVCIIEKLLNKKALYTTIPANSTYKKIDNSLVFSISNKLGIHFYDEEYYVKAIAQVVEEWTTKISKNPRIR